MTDLWSKHQEVCAIIRRAGLAEAVGLDARNSMDAEVLRPESNIPFFRRYPFLEATPSPDLSGWDELFNATNFAGSVAITREVSPLRHETPADRLATSIPDLPYALPDQGFSTPWPSEEFQWQPPNNSHEIGGVSDQQALDEPFMMGSGHSLLDFSSNSFVHTR